VKKYLKRIIIIAICLFIFYQGSAVVNAGKEPAVPVEEMKARWYDTHYYPIYYGNEEWQKHDMYDFLDIVNPPEDLLLSMPTNELAKLMQEHPCLPQMNTYLDYDGKIDYETLFSFLEVNSDILYELLRREDGITCLLQEYQSNDVDLKKMNEETYDEESQAKWYAEMFGCHFIIYYSPLFSESEYIMAREILEEKSKRYYAELEDYQLEYMSLEDLTIEPPSGEPVKKIRTKYLDEEEIQEKEDRLEAARIKLDEIKKQEELERQKERAKEIRKLLVRCLIIGGTGIGVAGVVAGSVFIIRKRRRKDAD